MHTSTIKRITQLGLILMKPGARRERVEELVDEDGVNLYKLASLIDECRNVCFLLTGREEDSANKEQVSEIISMLKKIDGDEVVETMDPEELSEWVKKMREHSASLSPADLGTMLADLMKEMEGLGGEK